jgi:photosystem II stability/assembly factor-like uncharacterized protein
MNRIKEIAPLGCAFVVAVLAIEQPLVAENGVWLPVGPAGAQITSIVVDPQPPAIVHAGSAGTVYKSADGGTSWSANTSGLPGQIVQALGIDFDNPATLYAGTQGSGVFKSIDGGATWHSINDTRLSNDFIFAIAVDPRTPTTLYVSSNGDTIMKSTDGGTTWTSVGPVSVQALAIDPQTPSTIYAGTDLQVWKSVDGGLTWTATGLHRVSIFALAVDPQLPSTVYAGARAFGNPGGLYKSVDGGSTWMLMSNGLPSGAAVHAVAVDPQVPTNVYVGINGAGVFNSTDAAAHWSAMNEGLTSLRVVALAIDPETPSTMYAGTADAGVFVRRSHSTLTVSRAGPGDGTVTSVPHGIDCGTDCAEPFASGTIVMLTARPAFGSVFLRWEGCNAAHRRTCKVTMDSDRSVAAVFVGTPR